MPDRTRGVEEQDYNGVKYWRYADDVGHTLRGTVVLFDSSGQIPIRTVPGFPHINRVYRLRSGVRRFFHTNPFFVEEKLDGYNVRLLIHRGQPLALTRGGFICPFTTEWAEIWWRRYRLDRFFADYPDCVLFSEVLGDNPYNSQRDPAISPGLYFFVFDILGGDGEFLHVRDRYRVAENYELPTVPLLGQFSSDRIEELFEVLRDLNEKEREGVVLKSPTSKRAMKFVTPSTDLRDIKDNLILEFDLEPRFIINRLLRASLFIKEFGLDEDEYASRLGRAFLDGYGSLEAFESASETYNIYVQNLKTWNALRHMLSGHVTIKVEHVLPASLNGIEMLNVKFRRVFPKSTRRYREVLRGYGHID
ncbi:MAG TPA: RNA ligase [Thermodesulfobacteriota bacterium]|nr:RNA ligase [Thermodesulfobacteriota bacterium]